MEYISSFIYCDSIQTEITPQGPRHQIVNPLQVLMPIAVPGNYSFSVACTVAGYDVKQENRVKIRFCSASGQILYDTGDIKIQIPAEQIIPEKPGVMQFNLDMRNLVFRETGLYSTIVYFNGVEIGEHKIEVIKGE